MYGVFVDALRGTDRSETRALVERAIELQDLIVAKKHVLHG
jgi:hypothetical protein